MNQTQGHTVMKTIKTVQPRDGYVDVPGSKSISHRALICSALCRGRSRVINLLDSDDIGYTMAALRQMGARIKPVGPADVDVTGFGADPEPAREEIYLGNSGTSMRLIAGVAALGKTDYCLTGDGRMQERPMGDLLGALTQRGITASSRFGNGAPPVIINGLGKTGGSITLDCSQSSQFLSSVLMMGALLPEGLDIHLPGPAVSAPYVMLTLDVMQTFGVSGRRISDTRYQVAGGQTYQPGEFTVEPDLSNASYFWGAGAITGSRIGVRNVSKESFQGDFRLIEIFEAMGCHIETEDHGVSVAGSRLKAVDVDMSDIPDVVPTLAVVAAFAEGKTVVRNIRHLREKECDRIDAVVSQLRKMGVDANQGEDWLSVVGGSPKGARIETFNDHRIAMAFSVAGLRVPGMEIVNPACVKKSFPTFWDVFERMENGR